jgi:hypothetical protein
MNKRFCRDINISFLLAHLTFESALGRTNMEFSTNISTITFTLRRATSMPLVLRSYERESIRLKEPRLATSRSHKSRMIEAARLLRDGEANRPIDY